VAHTAGDIMATIVSRCQQLKFRPVSKPEIAAWLMARDVPADHAHMCAAWSDGLPGMADYYATNSEAVELLNQRLDEFIELPSKSLPEGFKWAEEWAKTFRGGGQADVYAGLLLWQRIWRDVLWLTTNAAPDAITWVNRSAELQRMARGVSTQECAGFLKELAQAVRQLRENANPQLVFEHLFLTLPNRK
jgi:DNA polymerase-3 subunit delta'